MDPQRLPSIITTRLVLRSAPAPSLARPSPLRPAVALACRLATAVRLHSPIDLEDTAS